jgi:hypothetical protein
MLPDFTLTLRRAADRPVDVVARDVPACVFFYGMPVVEPERGHRDRDALHAWIDTLLTRVVVRPRLSVDLVRRLGAARDELALRYFQAVGALAYFHQLDLDLERLFGEGEAAAAALVDVEPGWPLSAFATPPGPPEREITVALAERGAQLPATVWRQPISAWFLNWRILLAPHVDAALYTNDPRLLTP